MSNLNDSRGYQGEKGSDIGSLIRKNASDAEVLAALRAKHPNDVELVNKLYSEYDEKMSKIRRKAQKFANLLLTKYSHLGPKRIIEKAKKYQKKYGFSDDEFNAFLNIATSDKSFSSANIHIPNTPIAKTLGFTVDVPTKMNVKSTELDVLQDILKMHQECSALHAQVVIQSLMYEQTEECKVLYSSNPKDMFDPRKDNMYSNVHPVLFALFAPKIKDLEDRMLLGSIASVVAARYNGTPFKTQSDWLLYHDLIQDPNEVVCAGNQKDNPLIDLRNRVRVQCELWKNVRDLRQGRFYAPDCQNFLVALKNCKNNMYDSPDYTFVEDEGSVLRRLLSVFAYRPTIVAVKSAANATLPFAIASNVNTYAMTQVTTVPIINIRLPSNSTGTSAVALATSLSSPDWYIENKVLVPKTKEVIHSRGVCFFYVNRRSFALDHTKLVGGPTLPQFNVLPFSISGYESVNKCPVELNPTMQIGNDQFNLKSVVSVETQPINQTSVISGVTSRQIDFIKGCKATVFCGNSTNPTALIDTGVGYRSVNNQLIEYNPLNIDDNTKLITPIKMSEPIRGEAPGYSSLEREATIIVYVKQA